MSKPLFRRHILLTAGPTREALDPVRFLTNPSTGEMGRRLAEVFQRLGAHVTVVSGPTQISYSKSIRVHSVVTARQMHTAVMKEIRQADAFIATAAVSDWRFARTYSQKMKKGTDDEMTVVLKKNPDILAAAGALKAASRKSRPVLIGFSLETTRTRQHAEEKMKRKNVDLMIGNSPASFGSSSIRALWMARGEKAKWLSPMTKVALASRVGVWLAHRLQELPHVR